MEGEVFKRTWKIYGEFDKAGDAIKELGKKHGESVEASLSILEKSRSTLLERGFEIAFSYMPGSMEERIGGEDSLRFLLEIIFKRGVRALPPKD